MKKILGLIILASMVINFTACSDDAATTNLPTCHDEIVENFRAIACSNDGDLTTWDFRGELVYCYATGNCITVPYAEIYDADCNLLCTLGGVNGLTLCEGQDWNSLATQQSTILVF